MRRGLALRTARPLIPELIRRLASLNEDAVRAKFSDLLQGSTLTANQIGFMHTNLDALLHSGYLETKELLEAPFDAYGNPLDLFTGNQAIAINLNSRLTRINSSAGVG